MNITWQRVVIHALCVVLVVSGLCTETHWLAVVGVVFFVLA